MTHTRHMNVGALTVSIFFALALISSSYALAHGNDDGHNVDATCMQTAVETREGALISAWEEFNTNIKSALEARKTALKDAWGLTDVKAQKKATAAAWKEWKVDSKAANAELKKERKTAWDTFKKTTKDTCKVTAPKEEALGKDAAGSIEL